MRRFKPSCALVALLGISGLTSAALASGVGNVEIQVNGGSPILYIGGLNLLEIYINNDAPLYGMTLTFEFSSTAGPFQFLTPYGDEPDSMPYVKEHNDAVGAFDLGGLQVAIDQLPNKIVLSGASSSIPFPAGPTRRLCYTMMFTTALNLPEIDDGFCVSIGELPPGDPWVFHEQVNSYFPNFQEQPFETAEPVCFSLRHCGCMLPEFTSVPPTTVLQSHCQPFTFNFEAVDMNAPGATLRYLASVGEMDYWTGEYLLTQQGCPDSTVVTVWAVDAMGDNRAYQFTVHWTNGAPALVNCPTETAKLFVGCPWTYNFDANDPDACEQVHWSAVSRSQPPPEGLYEIDSLTGMLSFTPAGQDWGKLWIFRIAVSDGCQLQDSCLLSVETLPCTLAGDAGGNCIINIADVVYLVQYIFSSGPPPNPPEAGDVNGDQVVNITDVVILIQYIFASGAPPVCY